MKLIQLEDGSFRSVREWDDVKDRWPYLQIDHNGKPQVKERDMSKYEKWQIKAEREDIVTWIRVGFLVIAVWLALATLANAQTYQTYGNTTYGSDGSTAQTYGSTTYYQPPENRPQVICQTYGNTTYCN